MAKPSLAELTLRLEQLMGACGELVTRSFNYASKAFENTAPAQLAGFPARSGITRAVSKMASALANTSAYVRTWQPALEAVGAPRDLAEQLDARMQELTDLNKVQEAAKREVDSAQEAVYETRGHIYNDCRAIYRAGRNAFRKDPETQRRFAFQFMTSNSGQAAKQEDTGSAERKATCQGPPSLIIERSAKQIR